MPHLHEIKKATLRRLLQSSLLSLQFIVYLRGDDIPPVLDPDRAEFSSEAV
jgi:hypothetical protein